MRNLLLFIVASLAIFLFGFSVNIIFNQRVQNDFSEFSFNENQEPAVLLVKSDFSETGVIPKAYTCDGVNQNPPLALSQVDPDVISLAILMEDTDTPDNNFVHWIVANIPASKNKIETGEDLSKYIEGRNDFGNTGYGGPCPPSGSHRYYLTVYGLNSMLDLETGFSKDDLNREMGGKVISQSNIVAEYKRQ